MAESLFSPSWYRVAKLKPRLRGHTEIHRHAYRGEVWHVLQDHATGRFYRFTPPVHHMIARMDGRRSVEELWEEVSGVHGDAAPTQGEVVRLLGQLHAADALLCDVPPDAEEILRRWKKTEYSRWKMNLRSPMSLSFPLFDPERILSRAARYVRPFFTVTGGLLWTAIVGTAVVLAGMHWAELTENFTDRVLTAENVVSMILVYPFLKALHEFGHGCAVKRWGGEVHEMGIMLLVLMPLPYVDASAATAFREKRRRMLVSAAGIMVDLFVASLAMFVWLLVSPGKVHSIAYNVILISSVSTVLFNGNPLLRYDGYYILSDGVEIPNLYQRGIEYVGYLFQRYVFGARQVQPPYAGPGERFWFVAYTVTSFVYRAFLYAGIILFIAGKFFIAGILLAVWAGISMIVYPAVKRIRFVATSPVLRNNRGRAVFATVAILAALLLLLFVVPVPSWTRTEGVVWVPEEALVRAGTSCFVGKVVVPPNSPVEKGTLLVECIDPVHYAEVRVLEAKLAELERRYDAARAQNPVETQILQAAIRSARADLARSKERRKELAIRSPAEGTFVIPGAQDLPDRFLKQGDLIAYVLNEKRPTVRVVVGQADVDLVRQRTKKVAVRLTERLERVVPAVLVREVPGGLERLPSTILGVSGGGKVAVDPRDAAGGKALEKLFQFDLELDRPVGNVYVGGRVYVRFDHGFEPAGFQWYRTIRQMFLRRFHV